MIASLAHEFGAPNSLEQDLKTLYDTAAYSDAILTFTSDSSTISAAASSTLGPYSSTTLRGGDCGSLGHCGGVRNRGGELRCHRAMLAARSPFFRSLITRRNRAANEPLQNAASGSPGGGTLPPGVSGGSPGMTLPRYPGSPGGTSSPPSQRRPMNIVLDDGVIPRCFARALLTAVYLDVVDTSSIIRNSLSLSTLNTVAMASSSSSTSAGGDSTASVPLMSTSTNEAMELYHIGRFLEFPALTNGRYFMSSSFYGTPH